MRSNTPLNPRLREHNAPQKSNQLRIWALCLGALLIVLAPLQASAAAPKPPTKYVALVAWHGVQIQFRANYWLAVQLLRHESKANFKNGTVQLRIQWNAASLGRLTKAYTYYLSELKKHFPKQSKTWKQYEDWNARLRAVAKKLRMEALQGEKSKGWDAKLDLLQAKIPWKLAVLPKKVFQPKYFGKLLNSISGMGAGVEILSYYRFFQAHGALKGKAKTKASLNPFYLLDKKLAGHRKMFRALRKAMPKANWLKLFSYHLALLSRCSKLTGQIFLGKGPQKKRKATFEKRKKQLQESMQKANSSLKKFWRL